MRKYTLEEIKKTVSEISNCELLSTEYTGVHNKLRFRCSCGAVFEKDWAHFRRDRQPRCPRCAQDHVNACNRLSVESVRARISKAGCELLDNEYRGRRQPLHVRFRCGHDGYASLNVIEHPQFSGECKACLYARVHGANRYLYETVYEKCQALGVELVSSSYTNAKTPMQFRCACGRIFTRTWDAVSQGQTRCPRCALIVSAGVLAIETWLNENRIPYVREKTFPGCVSKAGKRFRFDFYLPGYNLCVEYDGEQHFRPATFGSGHPDRTAEEMLRLTQENDRSKSLWCEQNAVGLIRIDYTQQQDIPDILGHTLIPR